MKKKEKKTSRVRATSRHVMYEEVLSCEVSICPSIC